MESIAEFSPGPPDPYIGISHRRLLESAANLHTCILVGTFLTQYTQRGRPSREISDGEREAKDISIPSTALPLTFPTVFLGVSFLDVGTGDWETHLRSYIDNVHPDGFTCHVDTHGRTRLYGAQVNYLVVDAFSRLLQTGSIESQRFRPWKHGWDTVQRVDFRHPYAAPPKVLVVLGGFNLGGWRSNFWEIRSFATDVDNQGFTVHIEKKKDANSGEHGVLRNGQVYWFAYPQGGIPGLAMCSGEVRVAGATSRGRVVFEQRFASPPKVFVGLTQFDMGWKTIRIRVEVDQVTEEGMDWKVHTWMDTVLHSASFVYLAIEDVG